MIRRSHHSARRIDHSNPVNYRLLDPRRFPHLHQAKLLSSESLDLINELYLDIDMRQQGISLECKDYKDMLHTSEIIFVKL